MEFKKAQRQKSKLRLGITGPSGSGKTWGALELAKGLGGKIAVIDTENGSASMYEHLAEFDVLELGAPYTPDRYIQAIKAAESAGYDVLIIDSITHEWKGAGGCLEMNERIAAQKFKGNTWSAWSITTPLHRKFIDALVASPMHVIVTMRSKTETVQGENKRVEKLGMKSEQSDGFEYEMTVVIDLIHKDHLWTATKDRTGVLTDYDNATITPELGQKLLGWLNSGAEPEPEAVLSPGIASELMLSAEAGMGALRACRKRHYLEQAPGLEAWWAENRDALVSKAETFDKQAQEAA